MVDIVQKSKRSIMMSGIRSKNTKPELLVRKALFAHGYRYRLHVKGFAGQPDLILPKYRAVVFVNGCFWHCHGCHLFKWPQSRTEFWHKKILSNKVRDLKNHSELSNKGWRIAVIWECSLKGKNKLEFSSLISTLEDWLQSDEIDLEISC
jgi:DNA mismatch endonuclease (patch repair protein)